MITSRRTSKQKRSLQTRQRLLGATIEELAARGYTELRTAAIALRCGVSQGTVFAHFGTKVQLVVAAVEYYFAREVHEDTVRIDPDAPIEDRVCRLLEVMWAEMSSDDYLGVLEVYSAARTNDALREALAPIAAAEIEHAGAVGHAVLSHIAGLDADAHTRGQYDGLVATLVYTLQAAAREAATLGRINAPEPLLRFLQAQLVRELRVSTSS